MGGFDKHFAGASGANDKEALEAEWQQLCLDLEKARESEQTLSVANAQGDAASGASQGQTKDILKRMHLFISRLDTRS